VQHGGGGGGAGVQHAQVFNLPDVNARSASASVDPHLPKELTTVVSAAGAVLRHRHAVRRVRGALATACLRWRAFISALRVSQPETLCNACEGPATATASEETSTSALQAEQDRARRQTQKTSGVFDQLG
jgi:hypothetical protein